jgi:hypothetical protein
MMEQTNNCKIIDVSINACHTIVIYIGHYRPSNDAQVWPKRVAVHITPLDS